LASGCYQHKAQSVRFLQKSEQLHVAFTGVVPSHRRQGLATALKIMGINFAKKAGYKRIRTGNEENNPMLTLNKKSGFIELTASLAFEKRL